MCAKCVKPCSAPQCDGANSLRKRKSKFALSRTKPKKVWELKTSCMCSLVGTCFSLAELHRIKKRAKVEDALDAVSDYELHAYFVKAAPFNAPVGRAMQGALERKYAQTWKKFAQAASVEDLRELWQGALTEGDVAGPFWALLAHPLVTHELEESAFGEVHMLSHLVGSTNRADLKTMRSNEIEIDKLRDDFEQARCHVWSRDRIIAGLRTQLDDARREARNATFAHYDGVDKTAGGAAPEQNLTVIVESLRSALNKADKLNYGMQDALARKAKRIEFLETERYRLKDELATLEAESRVLETTIPVLMGETCANDGGICPGEEACPYDLCRKRVLYVGGRATLVSRYRNVVEGWNGEFLHHDGGLEQSLDRLGGLLEQADLVVFPADCVSHAAVEHIKTRCQHNGKRMMAVRSSGLGSFMRGLQDIAASASKGLSHSSIQGLASPL